MVPEGFNSVESSHRFRATRERLERACVAHGMTVFARIDHSSAAAGAGLSLRPTEVFLLGNARAGTPLMSAFPHLAIDLPLRILIWEDEDGRASLGYNEPDWIVRRQTNDPGLQPQIEAMRTTLSEILADVAGSKE
jgi:uncharacterized protein (DUF302 family)